MDNVDKKLLYFLLKDARMPLRKIAEELGISAQALNYRMAKLYETGVIRKYSLHVNPKIYGKVNGFAAYKNDRYMSPNVISKFKCLEEITIYEFAANTMEELEDEIRKAETFAGLPIMKYIPEQRDMKMNIGETDRRILEYLKKDPRMSVVNLAKELGLANSSVRKRINLMEKNHVIAATTEIDLSKTDIVLFSIISKNVRNLIPVITDQPILVISDRDNGILVCFSENLKQARYVIENSRKTDPSAEVMVVYDYEFN